MIDAKGKDDGVTIGEENFSWNKESATIKDVVLRHIRHLSDISCQELTAGYEDRKVQKVGESFIVLTTYHPDLREAYINGVDFLLTLVIHCGPQDTEGDFPTILKKIEDNEDEEYKKAREQNYTKTEWIDVKLVIKKNLLREIMLMLDRIQFFSGSDGGITE
jgi:hypothetical protein